MVFIQSDQLITLQEHITSRDIKVQMAKVLLSEHKYMEKAWKKMWAIDCPNKMKVILWRMSHDCLPTGYQFCVRSLHIRYDCYFCNKEETVEHCFLYCHYVKEI
jgi:hypothetical protein